MGTQPENFELRWNDFQANISSVFKHLRSSTDFQDVTLVCETGTEIKAHKVILSACSPYFQSIMKNASHSTPHPIILMPHDVKYEEMMNIVDFMYYGEVGIPEDDLSRFLTVAEQFQVRGLVENVPKVEEDEGGHGAGGGGGKRPRLNAGGDSYQPLGSYQPPGLVCPRCRIICRDGPQGLTAHMAVCGQERPVLQVAPSRQQGQRGAPAGRARARAGRGRGGGQSRRSREQIKPSHTHSEGSRHVRPGQGPVGVGQGPVRAVHGQARAGQGGRPNLMEIGQKLGMAVSITSVAGQNPQPEVKQEPGESDEETMETPADQTVETEQERQYQDRGEEEAEEEDTSYENQFSEAYEGAGDLGEEYLRDGDNYPGYEDYDENTGLAESARH